MTEARHTETGEVTVHARFAGRSVVVTGAGSGIGHAMAAQFAREGADVVAADIDPNGVPDGCVAVRVDVSDEDDVARLVATAWDRNGRIDVLCNNAGVGSTASVVSCRVEEWDRLFAINVRGVFLGIKHALPGMLERGSGSIVNTASVAAFVGLRDRAAYAATKGAVVALTKQVAGQYADRGVRCNCICPGTVDSPWVGRLLAAADDTDAARTALVARQPMGRLGTPEEVAAAAVFLASDDAAFCTGTAFVIDGGLTAGR